MRARDRILTSLESAYREAFEQAKKQGEEAEMARLDFQFQRDQIRLEVLLDLRDLLASRSTATAPPAPPPERPAEKGLIEEGTALLEKAQALKKLTRLR